MEREGQAPADSLGRRINSAKTRGLGPLTLASNLALLGLWVWLYRPVFDYFAVIFTRVEFRTNQIVLLAVAGLLLYRARQDAKLGKFRPRLDAPPRLSLPALALILGGSLGFLLAERYLDVNMLSSVLFALASYGLLGLWMDPARWRAGLPAALLVTGVLPFGAHLETFAGYPLRLVTAQVVRELLAGLGFTSVGADTILVFESGVSQVDIPCSGVKSLWTGALFLLAATWIEERALGLRWLLIAALTGALLALSNLLRVAVLALVGPALGFPQYAEMLHVPLGVLGFCAACAAALVLIRRLPARTHPQEKQDLRVNPRPRWLSPLLALVVLAMALAYTPRPAQSAGGAGAPPAWSFPAGTAVEPAPLTAQELDWIRQGGAENAERFTFRYQPAGGSALSGTLLLLTSQTWRGQHQPERCFEVFGFTVENSYTALAAADFPMRYLSLSHPALPDRSLAAYWLQTASQTTDDYGQRIWADFSPARERWVLVTILFDQPTRADDPGLAPFFQALRASVSRSLSERGVP